MNETKNCDSINKNDYTLNEKDYFRIKVFEQAYEDLIVNLTDISNGICGEKIEQSILDYSTCAIYAKNIVESHFFERIDYDKYIKINPIELIGHPDIDKSITNTKIDEFMNICHLTMIKENINIFSYLCSFLDDKAIFNRILKERENEFNTFQSWDELLRNKKEFRNENLATEIWTNITAKAQAIKEMKFMFTLAKQKDIHLDSSNVNIVLFEETLSKYISDSKSEFQKIKN